MSAQDVLVLERQLARAVASAERAEAMIELQKKIAASLAEPFSKFFAPVSHNR